MPINCKSASCFCFAISLTFGQGQERSTQSKKRSQSRSCKNEFCILPSQRAGFFIWCRFDRRRRKIVAGMCANRTRLSKFDARLLQSVSLRNFAGLATNKGSKRVICRYCIYSFVANAALLFPFPAIHSIQMIYRGMSSAKFVSLWILTRVVTTQTRTARLEAREVLKL